MNSITYIVGAVMMSLIAAAPPKAPPAPGETPAARADIKNLQGTWKVVRAENKGMNVKDSLGYEEFIIEGTTTKVIYQGEERKGSFELDPAHKPKWITFTSPKGTVVPAIYELKGDKWRVLSRNAGRPEGWDAPGCALMEYERVKIPATKPATRPAS